MKNLRLGTYFTLDEMTKSVTAKRLGINNDPFPVEIVNMLYLVQCLLDPLREAYGRPIVITSGYRSDELNSAIGGSDTSQHCKGLAADIECATGNNSRLFHVIRDDGSFDQLIWEFGDESNPDWIHVSWAETLRGELLRAFKEDGKTRYTHG